MSRFRSSAYQMAACAETSTGSGTPRIPKVLAASFRPRWGGRQAFEGPWWPSDWVQPRNREVAKAYYSTVFDQSAPEVRKIVRDFNTYPVQVDGAAGLVRE